MTNMKRFVCILLLFSTICSFGQEVNNLILGLAIGKTYTPLEVKSILNNKSQNDNYRTSARINRESSWTEIFSGFEDTVPFAGEKWHVIIIISSEGKLAKIVFHSVSKVSFSDIVKKYEKKYGIPSESENGHVSWGEEICVSIAQEARGVCLTYFSPKLCEQIESDVLNEI